MGDARVSVDVGQQGVAQADETAIGLFARLAIFPGHAQSPEAVEPDQRAKGVELNPALVEFRRQVEDMDAAAEVVHVGHELVAAADRWRG